MGQEQSTVRSPGQSTSTQSQDGGGQETPVYQPPGLDKYKSLFDPIVPQAPKAPDEMTSESLTNWQQSVFNANAEAERRRTLQRDLRQIAETGKVTIGGETIQLTPADVDRVLSGVQSGFTPTASTLVTAIAPDVVVAQARMAAERGIRKAGRTDQQTDPTKKVDPPTVVGGPGAEQFTGKKRGPADEYAESLPARDVDTQTLWLLSLKQAMGPEKFQMYRDGQLVVESPYDDDP